jgi:hypothetical protein
LCSGRAGLGNRAPVVLIAGEALPTVADRGLVEAEVALLVTGAERDAEFIAAERVAEDAGHFRGDGVALQATRQVVDRGVDDAFRAEAGVQAGIVQRPRGLDVDRRTDAAGRRAGPAGLIDFDRADRFGGEVREVERTRFPRFGVCDR